MLGNKEIAAQVQVQVFTEIGIANVFEFAPVVSVSWISVVDYRVNVPMAFAQICDQRAYGLLAGDVELRCLNTS